MGGYGTGRPPRCYDIKLQQPTFIGWFQTKMATKTSHKQQEKIRRNSEVKYDKSNESMAIDPYV